MKYRALKALFNKDLEGLYGQQESSGLFYISLEKIEGSRRIEFLEKQGNQAPPAVQAQMLLVLNELKLGKPLQYILQETYFYGLKFRVTHDVLIPRDETEELVDLIIKDVKSSRALDVSLLDVGTGSGCIVITLKRKLPQLQVSALEISASAIAVAKENALLHNTAIDFIKADILNFETDKKFDIIVSNPPYIKEVEKSDMHRNVLEFEPHGALFVSDTDPLIFYKAIADLALKSLSPSGKLYFEINERLGNEMIAMITEKGFKDIRLIQDLQQKDRILACKL